VGDSRLESGTRGGTAARALAERLVCPECGGRLDGELACVSCRLTPRTAEGLVDFLGAREPGGAAAAVRAFYEARPFPGYSPADDAPTLIDRGLRSSFLTGLDAALAPDARLVDCGAGTAQVGMFLALRAPRRQVFAVDGCRASLLAAHEFRTRARVDNLHLVRADLFALPFAPESFDVVLCRGVVHHTPRPYDAIDGVAARVAPGGILLLGIYESWARALHVARRGLGRLRGKPIAALDPLLRRRDLDAEKKRTWIEDQYRHPLERLMPMPRVVAHLEARGFEWLRSVPPAAGSAPLFAATERPSSLGFTARRLGWAARGLSDEDAGLVMVVMRRHRR
jgi:SAM-dependent methyltransferase